MYMQNTTAANAQNAQIAGDILKREDISELFSDCFEGNWFGDRTTKTAQSDISASVTATDDTMDTDAGDYFAKMRRGRRMALRSLSAKTTDRDTAIAGAMENRPAITSRIPRPVMMAPVHLGQLSILAGAANAIAAE